MVGLCVDVLWVVVWLSVRAVGTVCEVEGDVQVVNSFHVCLYSYVKSVSLEASCYSMSFLIRSACGPDVCLKMASPSSLYRPMLSLPYSLQRSLRIKRPTNSHTSAPS